MLLALPDEALYMPGAPGQHQRGSIHQQRHPGSRRRCQLESGQHILHRMERPIRPWARATCIEEHGDWVAAPGHSTLTQATADLARASVQGVVRFQLFLAG